MTIEEAIKYCEEVYREKPVTACGAEHRQLAEWLTELEKNTLSNEEAFAVAELIDISLYDRIRNDTDIDSMQWLINTVHAYEKLCRMSGYQGLTDDCGKDELK